MSDLEALSAYLDTLLEQLYRDGVLERDFEGSGRPEPHAARLEAVARWLRRLADDRPGKEAGPSPDSQGAGHPPPRSHLAGPLAIACGWCGFRMTESYARCASCSELCDACAQGAYCPECAHRVAYETEMEARYDLRKDLR